MLSDAAWSCCWQVPGLIFVALIVHHSKPRALGMRDRERAEEEEGVRALQARNMALEWNSRTRHVLQAFEIAQYEDLIQDLRKQRPDRVSVRARCLLRPTHAQAGRMILSNPPVWFLGRSVPVIALDDGVGVFCKSCPGGIDNGARINE